MADVLLHKYLGSILRSSVQRSTGNSEYGRNGFKLNTNAGSRLTEPWGGSCTGWTIIILIRTGCFSSEAPLKLHYSVTGWTERHRCCVQIVQFHWTEQMVLPWGRMQFEKAGLRNSLWRKIPVPGISDSFFGKRDVKWHRRASEEISCHRSQKAAALSGRVVFFFFFLLCKDLFLISAEARDRINCILRPHMEKWRSGLEDEMVHLTKKCQVRFQDLEWKKLNKIFFLFPLCIFA